MNGIIIDGKVYEAKPEYNAGSCMNCDLKTADKFGCPCADMCIDWESIFRYSQSLTDKLNKR